MLPFQMSNSSKSMEYGNYESKYGLVIKSTYITNSKANKQETKNILI
jgi:hypothetical protein